MNVEPVECLSDNYAYLIWRDGSHDALVVDPSEGSAVERAVSALSLRLVGILCTHHHGDHVGGVKDLCKNRPDLFVYCSSHDMPRIAGSTRGFSHDDTFESIELQFRCLHVPGHTLGALAYAVEDAVFTGDTLFGAGCGRLFEGTPEQMNASLEILGSLAGTTRVYFGHEYTRSNLAFAQSIEPGNPRLRARITREAQGRTTPSTIEEERATNPFMRCAESSIREALGPGFAQCAAHKVFAEVRRQKDGFRS